MGKTSGTGAGFKVRKLRIRQRWAQKKYKKSHTKKIVPEKKRGIKQDEEENLPYYYPNKPYIRRPPAMPPFPANKRKCAIIQYIKIGDKITRHYYDEYEEVLPTDGVVLSSHAVRKCNQFVLS